MKVAVKLTEAALAERLDEVMDRASQGEVFAIERDGEVIALIRPPASSAQPGITWGEFVAKYRDLPRPDDRFADDLEAILAEQRSAPHVGATRGTTWEEFAARVEDLPFPGDGFADDLEAIQAAQGIADAPEWPD
jgi:hypothetical protein